MANFDLQTYTIVHGTVEGVVAALETQMETITNTKTFHLCNILQQPDKKYIGVLIYTSDTPSASPSSTPSASPSASPSSTPSSSPS